TARAAEPVRAVRDIEVLELRAKRASGVRYHWPGPGVNRLAGRDWEARVYNKLRGRQNRMMSATVPTVAARSPRARETASSATSSTSASGPPATRGSCTG